MHEYLGLEGGPPMFRQDFTCPALLESKTLSYLYGAITHLGPTFQMVPVEKRIGIGLVRVRSPLLTESLIDFLSSGYLDVSVPRVRFPCGMT